MEGTKLDGFGWLSQPKRLGCGWNLGVPHSPYQQYTKMYTDINVLRLSIGWRITNVGWLNNKKMMPFKWNQRL
jgi:hypothetical protein